jgi:hypothetical protein
MTLKVFLIPVLALLIPAECGYNNDGIGGDIADPPQHILGKWQEIARGNDAFPELPSDGRVIEFLPDGTCHTGWTATYRLDAEFLYRYAGEFTFIDRYSFSGTDTLRLDYVYGVTTASPGTPTFYIFKRLKTNEQ